MASEEIHDVREMIIQELSLAGLSSEQQARIIREVSKALVERASIALMSRLPVETLERINSLAEDAQADALIMAATQSGEEGMKIIVRNAFQEGLEIYRQYLLSASSDK